MVTTYSARMGVKWPRIFSVRSASQKLSEMLARKTLSPSTPSSRDTRDV